MTGLLASICSTEEAAIALNAYADIIDCKDPSRGALGALDPGKIREIVNAVDGKRPVSATLGDLPPDPERIRIAIRKTAHCGVDYIKLGLFDEATAAGCIEALEEVCGQHKLIAVCFADRFDPSSLVPLLALYGFYGVMIDTAEKLSGRLTDLWTLDRLSHFVDQARRYGLVCGVAGRLTIDDIPSLLSIKADYLGFRSALCISDRTSRIEHEAVVKARNALSRRQDAAAVSTPLPSVR
ncbi:MAG: (5-formylfuran-3-yl)methyl phosphate synthase [Sedimenticola sp.]|nr:(5-formylfuran-3-yl)methyl phosphate synthase [Sedimenticola sp.]